MLFSLISLLVDRRDNLALATRQTRQAESFRGLRVGQNRRKPYALDRERRFGNDKVRAASTQSKHAIALRRFILSTIEITGDEQMRLGRRSGQQVIY
jgi:hypothetical protein